MTEIRTDWSSIKPTVWHCNAYDDRLYLFISPSGKTHIAKLIRDVNTEFMGGSNYEFTTLCNRTFIQYNPETKVGSGWHRPRPLYDLIHNPEPDGFLGVTCPRCAKLEPKFSIPKIKIDTRPHESELCEDESIWDHDHDLWSSDIIPQVLHDPEKRCETCNKTCPPEDIERRRKIVIEWWHQGAQPRACDWWQEGIYSTRQREFQLTDEQLESLSRYRLKLVYDHLVTTAWPHEVDASFQIRVLRVLEGGNTNDDM